MLIYFKIELVLVHHARLIFNAYVWYVWRKCMYVHHVLKNVFGKKVLSQNIWITYDVFNVVCKACRGDMTACLEQMFIFDNVTS